MSWRIRGVVLVALLLALGYWAWRGPMRAIAPDTGSADLRVIAASARGFVHGVNPYDFSEIARYWPRAKSETPLEPDWRGSEDLLYPPSALVLFAPVAMLGWEWMTIAWMGVNALALVVIVLALWRLMEPHATGRVRVILLLAALVLAPVVSTFALGQSALVTLALIAGGHWARLVGRPWVSGVLIGLAAALKPQIGLVFLAYELFRCRWRAGVAGVAILGAVLVIGVVRLGLADVDWVDSLRANVSAFMTTGRGDPSMANPMRYQLINLHAPLHVVSGNRALVNAGVWLIVGGLALAYFLIWLRRRESRDELLTLAMACPLTLLLAYHRGYDAVLVLIPLAWALRQVSLYRRAQVRSVAPALGVLVCGGAFVLPSNSILFALEWREILPTALTSSRLYDLIIEPHQIWALVAMAGALIWAMAQQPRARAAIFRREPAGDAPTSAVGGDSSPASPRGPDPTPT